MNKSKNKILASKASKFKRCQLPAINSKQTKYMEREKEVEDFVDQRIRILYPEIQAMQKAFNDESPYLIPHWVTQRTVEAFIMTALVLGAITQGLAEISSCNRFLIFRRPGKPIRFLSTDRANESVTAFSLSS